MSRSIPHLLTLLAISLTLLQASTVLVRADYVVTLNITSYINQHGHCATCRVPNSDLPGCCDVDINNCPDTGDLCDTRFLYCLRSISPPMTFAGQVYCSPVNRGTFTPFDSMNNNAVNFSQDMVLGLRNPFNLTGISTEYRGVTLYILVMDQDDGSVDIIDEFFINVTSPLGSTSRNRQYVGLHTIALMGLSYTVSCAQYYYGTFCENLNICELNAVSCSGRGRCVDGEEGNTFSCDCQAGFTGDLCERVDYCNTTDVDCGENGVCVNTRSGNSLTVCVCNDGYTGQTCGQLEGAVATAVIIAASVGGGLVLLLGSILGVILIYVCYRNAPRPQPTKATITHRRTPRNSQAALYSQFRWSRFDPTQAPPLTTPSAYQHTVNMNRDPNYNPAPSTFKPTEPPQTRTSSGIAPAPSESSSSQKMKLEKKIEEEPAEDKKSISDKDESQHSEDKESEQSDVSEQEVESEQEEKESEPEESESDKEESESEKEESESEIEEDTEEQPILSDI